MSEIHGFKLCDPPLGIQLQTTSVGTPITTTTLTVHQKQQSFSDFSNQIV